MLRLVCALLAVLQIGTTPDPHKGAFTDGIARRCGSCHAKDNPRAEDQYRAAAAMATMMAALTRGPLKSYPPITCFSCHRAGGPQHNSAHPMPLDRSAVRGIMERWPEDARDPEPMRRTMAEYSVSLGVNCDFCHVKGDWKASTKPTYRTTKGMSDLMNEFPRQFTFARAAAFTCFTCHQGKTTVARKPE